MASKNNINSVFTDIANSIRAKKGTTNTIQPINMAEEIDGIITGITPSGKIEITNTEEINVTNYETAQVVDSNLSAENIKEGVSILGTVGTFKGSSENTLKKLLDTTKSTFNLFYNYSGTSVDDLIKYDDTENVLTFQNMFTYSKITSLPNLNTSKVTDMTGMCTSCTKLQTLTLSDTSKVTTMWGLVQSCTKLQTVILSDTSKVKDMGYFANGDTKLETVSQLNMISVTSDNNTSNMFYNCKALTNLTLLNIKVNLQIGSGTSWGHLLTLDSLINTIMELWNYSNGSKSPTLTMGSANLEKIANTYVLVTDETTDKMTAEVCDSTTEGAITLEAFAYKKGWTLQ